MEKPSGCKTCPWYQSGKGFVPDTVVEDATVFVLAQNPEANDVRGERIVGWNDATPLTEPWQPEPLIGRSGWDFERVFLPLTGLERSQVSIGNVLRCRWQNSNDLPDKKLVAEAARHCEQYLYIPTATKLVIAVGNEAWKATQNRHDLSVYDWRGHLGPVRFHNRPVYAVLHFADLLVGHDPRMTLPTKMDWAKVPKILSGEYPKPLPPRLLVGQAAQYQVDVWFDRAMANGTAVAWDTEYLYDKENMWNSANYELTMVSAAVPELEQGIQLLYHRGPAARSEKAHFIRRFYELVTAKPSIFHNAKAEARAVHKTWGWDVHKVLWNFNDTMLAHAVRWSEWPHGLDFVESLYSPYAKIKHLPTTDPERNWGDTCITLEAWNQLRTELQNDPSSERVYRQQSLKLVLPTLERDMAGIAVNQDAIEPLLTQFDARVQAAARIAQSAAGWPINLNKLNQLKKWLKLCGYRLKRSKHRTGETLDKDAVAELRQTVSPFDAEWEQEVGADVEYVVNRIAEGADPVLECRAFFVRADKLAANYLRPLVVL